MIRHLVALRYADDVPQAERAALMRDLGAVADRLDGAGALEVRANLSPEDAVVHGFRDLFWIDFADAAARDAYLADPGHRRIGARLLAACAGGPAGLMVMDFAP